MLILSWGGGKRRKEKIFNMLFKLINITNQRQFGKSVLWLQAHCGSAHSVKLSRAEASFYLEESGTGSPSITGTARPSPAPERFPLFTHSLTSCHPSPSTFLLLILDTFPKLQLHNPFTCCDHQTKTRKRLELKFPAGWNLVSCLFYSPSIDSIWKTEYALGLDE